MTDFVHYIASFTYDLFMIITNNVLQLQHLFFYRCLIRVSQLMDTCTGCPISLFSMFWALGSLGH